MMQVANQLQSASQCACRWRALAETRFAEPWPSFSFPLMNADSCGISPTVSFSVRMSMESPSRDKIRVLSLKTLAGKLNPGLQVVVQNMWQLERRIFPKHESLSSSLQREVQRKNCSMLYTLVDAPGGEDVVVAGYLMFSWSSLTASITKLAVREGCRRSGYGEALLRTAVEQIRQRKLHSVNLHVDTTREPALALYRKFGFTVDATVHSYYAPERDAYRMVLSLEDDCAPSS